MILAVEMDWNSKVISNQKPHSDIRNTFWFPSFQASSTRKDKTLVFSGNEKFTLKIPKLNYCKWMGITWELNYHCIWLVVVEFSDWYGHSHIYSFPNIFPLTKKYTAKLVSRDTQPNQSDFHHQIQIIKTITLERHDGSVSYINWEFDYKNKPKHETKINKDQISANTK